MVIFTKLKKAIKNPKLAIRVLREMTHKKLFEVRHKQHPWKEGIIKKKLFDSYDEYIHHQKEKIRRIGRVHYNARLRDAWLPSRISFAKHGMTVLCLGARLGGEVGAFIDKGCFAVGIDLEPMHNNKYVLYGDFHDIQFPDNTVDIIYTNSLDHALDVDRMIQEIKRTLKPGGCFVTEMNYGTEEGYSPGYYEVTAWKKIDDVADIIKKSGFQETHRENFDFPWGGKQIIFQKRK